MDCIRFIKYLFRVAIFAVVVLTMAGCSQLKYVPDDQYLVKDVKIRRTTRELNQSDLSSYLRQKENLKILGIWRLHLGLYNLSGKDTSRWYNRTLKRIGEAPVLFDANQTDLSRNLLEQYLKSKGYFLGTVKDTVIPKGRQKVRVEFSLYPSHPYSIGQLYYDVEDVSLDSLVKADSTRTYLKRNRHFDSQLHDNERERITSKLRNQGYYLFTKDYIYFKADSTLGNYLVSDTLVVAKPLVGQNIHAGNHKRFKYRSVYYIIGDNPQKALLSTDEESDVNFDTLVYRNTYFLYKQEMEVLPSVLLESSYVIGGELYNASNVDKTRQLLAALGVFRYVDVRFKTVEVEGDPDFGYLDCFIQLVPAKKQSFSVQVEGTNSSGNLGAGMNMKYQHRNLFKGAELFNWGFRASEERQFVRGTEDRFNTFEIGSDVGIESPKFIFPFISEDFRRRHSPRTSLQMAYNYQRRPDYVRTIGNLRLGYNWRNSRYVTHYLYPSEFSLVFATVHPDFWNDIKNTFLRYSYEDHLVLNSSYSFVYNTQTRSNQPEFFFGRLNVEAAGNLLNGLAPMWQSNSDQDYNDILGIRFAQYAKSDVEIRYHHALDKYNALAYRFFAGVAYPYGNSRVMPFEEKYFSGGANGIRAWPVRGLGPGTYRDTISSFYNQTADIKLEANAEYRFQLFWLLEGAFFADAGNIWAIRGDASPEGGLFQWKSFYNQIAVGTGFGLRLDFDYFLIRFDIGVKVHDPTMAPGHRWVFGAEQLKWDEMAFNIAIGYPF